MAFAVWFTYFKPSANTRFSLPYVCQSPISYKRREFNSLDDIWDEIDKINEVNAKTSRTIGQDLFHLIPLFTDPYYIIEGWMIDMINEFNMVKNFNISLGVLDSISADRLNCFTIIQNEYNSITQYEAKK